MALKITDDCFNCTACEIECAFGAISQPGIYRKGSFYSATHYYIIPGKCNECREISYIPRCIMVCPVDAIINDKKELRSQNIVFENELV